MSPAAVKVETRPEIEISEASKLVLTYFAVLFLGDKGFYSVDHKFEGPWCSRADVDDQRKKYKKL